MPRPSRLTLLLVALPLFAAACKKKPPATTPAVQTETPPARPADTTPTRTVPTTTTNPNAVAEAIAKARAELLATIYFDYDAAELRSDAQATLTAKLPVLTANPQLKIRINGHTDERGSDVYNIALGKRRAEMAKRFLTDRGVDASRIETFSFGRERPEVTGSTEDAWAKNRRDMFEVISGELTKAP